MLSATSTNEAAEPGKSMSIWLTFDQQTMTVKLKWKLIVVINILIVTISLFLHIWLPPLDITEIDIRITFTSHSRLLKKSRDLCNELIEIDVLNLHAEQSAKACEENVGDLHSRKAFCKI